MHEHVHENSQQDDAEEPTDNKRRRLQTQPPANNMKSKSGFSYSKRIYNAQNGLYGFDT